MTTNKSLPIAIITGAAGGIGRALCEQFKDAGYRVVATDKVQPKGWEGAFYKIDLAELCNNDVYRHNSFEGLTAVLDGGTVNVLVNNAAVQRLGGCDELNVGDWRTTLNINLIAPFLLTQFLSSRLEKGNGSVINMGSVHSCVTKPGFVAYATSKSALAGLTQSMAVDVGSRFRINAILPAAIDTPMLREGFKENKSGFDELANMHPLGRLGDVDDIAKAALFLASSNASFMTGTLLEVDGGISKRLHDPENKS